MTSCSHDYRAAKAHLERTPQIYTETQQRYGDEPIQILNLESGPEPLIPLVPLSTLERAARDEEIAILTLRGFLPAQ